MPEVPAIVPHRRRQTPEHAPEGAAHMALIAEASLRRDGGWRPIRFAQQACGALNTETGRRFRQTFASGIAIGGSKPGGMSLHLASKIVHFQSRIPAKVPNDGTEPDGRRAPGFAAGIFNQPADRGAKPRLRCFLLA